MSILVSEPSANRAAAVIRCIRLLEGGAVTSPVMGVGLIDLCIDAIHNVLGSAFAA